MSCCRTNSTVFIVVSVKIVAAGIIVLIAGGIAIKRMLDASFPTTQQTPEIITQQAVLEREAQRLAEVRRQYVSTEITQPGQISERPKDF
jgi:hypothetical protein